MILAEVRLEHAGEDLHGCAFSYAVPAEDAGDLAEDGDRNAIEVEAVLVLMTMKGVFIKVVRQVDDVYGAERASLGADAAAGAESSLDVRLAIAAFRDALISCPVDRAHPDAEIIAAFLGMAFVFLDDSYSTAHTGKAGEVTFKGLGEGKGAGG